MNLNTLLVLTLQFLEYVQKLFYYPNPSNPLSTEKYRFEPDTLMTIVPAG